MAATPVQVDGIASGQTGLVLRLFSLSAAGWDTQVNADAELTEGANALTVYQCTVSEELTGWHRAIVFDADDNALWCGYVYLYDTTALHVAHISPSDVLAAVARSVWDASTAAHITAGTFGLLMQAIYTAVGALSSAATIAAAVWAYATRTLTSSAAQTAATVAGSTLTITRGDTASISITGLGSIADRTKLWFTVKRIDRETDSAATIQITEDDGLLRLNGSSYGTAAHGSIEVDDEDDGDITITLDKVVTALLEADQYQYDIQVLRSGGDVNTLTADKFIVSADITRATS